MDLEKIVEAVNLFNTTAPAIAQIFMSIKHADGTETVLTHVHSNQEQVAKNIADIQAMIDAHQPKG